MYFQPFHMLRRHITTHAMREISPDILDIIEVVQSKKKKKNQPSPIENMEQN